LESTENSSDSSNLQEPEQSHTAEALHPKTFIISIEDTNDIGYPLSIFVLLKKRFQTKLLFETSKILF